jgi:hypothetical protein
MNKPLIAVALACLMVGSVHGGTLTDFAEDSDNFKLMCTVTPTAKEQCGVAMKFTYDIILAAVQGCIHNGVKNGQIVQCIKDHAATLGFNQ